MCKTRQRFLTCTTPLLAVVPTWVLGQRLGYRLMDAIRWIMGNFVYGEGKGFSVLCRGSWDKVEICSWKTTSSVLPIKKEDTQASPG